MRREGDATGRTIIVRERGEGGGEGGGRQVRARPGRAGPTTTISSITTRSANSRQQLVRGVDEDAGKEQQHRREALDCSHRRVTHRAGRHKSSSVEQGCGVLWARVPAAAPRRPASAAAQYSALPHAVAVAATAAAALTDVHPRHNQHQAQDRSRGYTVRQHLQRAAGERRQLLTDCHDTAN